MAGITREEFHHFYNKEILPLLAPFENKRKKLEKFSKLKYILMGIFAILIVIMFSSVPVLMLITVFSAGSGNIREAAGFCFLTFPVMMVLGVVFIVVCGFLFQYIHQTKQLCQDIKKQLIVKIFSKCGVILSPNYMHKGISISELQRMGISLFMSKTDNDIVYGAYNGVNFIINEAYINPDESVKDPRLELYNMTQIKRMLIVRFDMNKSFKGRTFALSNDFRFKSTNIMQEVTLEDIDFMHGRKVYSTDQIEARYLFTTALIERLKMIEKSFNSSSFQLNGKFKNNERPNWHLPLGAGFANNYVYLFITSPVDFFEVSFSETLYNEDKYYNISRQLSALLSIVDLLKLDKKLGL